MGKKMSDRQRESLALAYIVDLDDCDPRNFRSYQIDGSKWIGSEGAAEWLCNRDSDWWRWNAEYITVYDMSGNGCLSAPRAPKGKRWVTSWIASECSCPWCGDGTGTEDNRESCDLCEGDGLLYHGEIVCHVYRLTRAEFDVQGRYSHGWETVCSEDDYRQARARLREYRANEGGTYRIVRRVA